MGRLNTTYRALIAAAVAGVFLMGMGLDSLWRASECPQYGAPVIEKSPAAYAATSRVRAVLWLSGAVY